LRKSKKTKESTCSKNDCFFPVLPLAVVTLRFGRIRSGLTSAGKAQQGAVVGCPNLPRSDITKGGGDESRSG